MDRASTSPIPPTKPFTTATNAEPMPIVIMESTCWTGEFLSLNTLLQHPHSVVSGDVSGDDHAWTIERMIQHVGRAPPSRFASQYGDRSAGVKSQSDMVSNQGHGEPDEVELDTLSNPLVPKPYCYKDILVAYGMVWVSGTGATFGKRIELSVGIFAKTYGIQKVWIWVNEPSWTPSETASPPHSKDDPSNEAKAPTIEVYLFTNSTKPEYLQLAGKFKLHLRKSTPKEWGERIFQAFFQSLYEGFLKLIKTMIEEICEQ
ncbi:hypothetical protein QFC22_001242 [Naganishia vaughanmartiniae]|uniref:Uncharacterized protein n=1 Tax=Naganishia vaughanmartiniae TaxID=1424756 RepID=A0ACC2XG98_9TREE|nr:hypothetical protein QFC22_001242 [Naganishia vaughanmartiniae]